MTNEVRDESKVEASLEERQHALEERLSSLEEMQRQLIAGQEEIQTHIQELQTDGDKPSKITFESTDKPSKVIEFEALLESEKSEALKTLCRLPVSAERPISWGYVGAYRTVPGQMTTRIASWSDDIDNFLSKASDAEIVNLASLFTDPTIIAVLRQLVEGKGSVADLAKACGVQESEIEKAVETLMDATLVARTEDDLIEPKNDVVSFFLNFVSMTIVHLGHIKSEN